MILDSIFPLFHRQSSSSIIVRESEVPSFQILNWLHLNAVSFSLRHQDHFGESELHQAANSDRLNESTRALLYWIICYFVK